MKRKTDITHQIDNVYFIAQISPRTGFIIIQVNIWEMCTEQGRSMYILYTAAHYLNNLEKAEHSYT